MATTTTLPKAKKFCFTYAIPGGAWVEFGDGGREWLPADYLDRAYGSGWFTRQFRAQGMFTGCWIDCID